MRIFFDTETTGLHAGEDEILQLSIIDENGTTLWNKKYKPQFHDNWFEAQQIHGISPNDVSSAPYIIEDIAIIQAIFDSAEKVYAYNAPFDLNFLKAIGVRVSSDKVVDTMRVYALKYHNKEYYKLENAARECGYRYHAHDALEDCKATLVVQNKVDGISVAGGKNSGKNKLLIVAIILLVGSFAVNQLFIVSIPLLIFAIYRSIREKDTSKEKSNNTSQSNAPEQTIQTDKNNYQDDFVNIIPVSQYVTVEDVIPMNQRPSGECLAYVGRGIAILGEEHHQELLKQYGYDAWLWVEVKQGFIRKGVNRGYPTYYVYLDGVEIGYITKYQMERHIWQVPDSGAVMLAHISNNADDIEKHQYQVTLQMQRPHKPFELTRSMEYLEESKSIDKAKITDDKNQDAELENIETSNNDNTVNQYVENGD